MEKFAVESIKIKSNWFDGGSKSMFQLMGREEGFNLYLQLFRYRIHQGNIERHYFITSVGEIRKFTKVNMSKKLSLKQVVDLLKKFEKLGIIKNHSFKDWNALYDDKGKVIADKMLKLEATDVPDLYKDKDNKQQGRTDEDKYLHISFDLINYIYEQNLSSKALSVFYLIRKWSNNSRAEKKAWMNINTIKERLGYGNDTVTSLLIELNITGLIVTTVKRKNKRDSFEHWAWFEKWNYPVEEHGKFHKEAIDIYLKRYKNSPLLTAAAKKHGVKSEDNNSVSVVEKMAQKEFEELPPYVAEPDSTDKEDDDDWFNSVADEDITDDSNEWGVEPNGYRNDDEYAV